MGIYQGLIIDAIKEGARVFNHDSDRFFSVSDGSKIAKLYPYSISGTIASYEFHNLVKVMELKDDRIRCPIPFGVLPVAMRSQLQKIGVNIASLKEPDYMVWGVVMENIQGKQTSEFQRGLFPYKQSLEKLAEALVANSIIAKGIKDSEILCLDDYRVALVDLERITWNLHALSERERVEINRKYRNTMRLYPGQMI